MAVLLIVTLTLLTGGSAVLLAARWLTGTSAVDGIDCRATAPLVPRIKSGPPWAQHRHYLELDGWYVAPPPPAAGSRRRRDYTVLNHRTGQSFAWSLRYAADGTTRFLVPTRYTLITNRHWREDPWLLCLSHLPPRP